MAARDDVVEIPHGDWTKFTNGSVIGDITFEVRDGAVEVQATAADAKPAADVVGLTLRFPGAGWKETTLAEIFTGVSGLDVAAYGWARPLYKHDGDNPALVRVSHA